MYEYACEDEYLRAAEAAVDLYGLVPHSNVWFYMEECPVHNVIEVSLLRLVTNIEESLTMLEKNPDDSDLVDRTQAMIYSTYAC